MHTHEANQKRYQNYKKTSSICRHSPCQINTTQQHTILAIVRRKRERKRANERNREQIRTIVHELKSFRRSTIRFCSMLFVFSRGFFSSFVACVSVFPQKKNNKILFIYECLRFHLSCVCKVNRKKQHVPILLPFSFDELCRNTVSHFFSIHRRK